MTKKATEQKKNQSKTKAKKINTKSAQTPVMFEAENRGEYEIKKLLIFIVVIIILFGLFYIFSLFIDQKDDTTISRAEGNAAVIQYDEIILGTLLTQPNDSYYVLVSKEDDSDLYSIYTSKYKLKEDSLKIYTSDFESPFNKMYIAEESNFNIESVGELRLKDDTLIKVENHELTEYFEGSTDILNELKNLNEN